MGKKASALILAACLALNTCNSVSAETASDLYKIYGKEIEIEYPKNVLKVLRNYTDAERYIYQYQYVTSSSYDEKALKSRIKNIKSECSHLGDKLLNAFNLSVDEIYATESRLIYLQKQLKDMKASLKSKDVKANLPEIEDLPTASDYRVAMETKSIIDKRFELGNVTTVPYPVSSTCLIKDSNDDMTTLLTVDGSIVSPIWSGIVVNVEDDAVIVYHYNNIYTCYSGLNYISVEKDDKVSVKDTIGKSSNLLKVQLRIDGEFVDLSRIFKGG